MSQLAMTDGQHRSF